MTEIKILKHSIITIIICIVYLLLTFFYYHIDKYLSGTLFFILILFILILFVAIVIYIIKGLIMIFSNTQIITFKFRLPTIFAIITLLYTNFSPYRFNSEILESNIELRACYEGTQNQAYIKFRQDKSFELNWTGIFYDEWWMGQWTKKGDTLFLKYDNKKQVQLGDTLLIANGYLNPIGHTVDTSKITYPMFYIGYCKNEN